MMGRMHLSGDLCRIDEEKTQLLRNSVALYKSYRDIIPSCRVYHHSGDVFYYEEEKPYALELRSEDNCVSVVMLKNYDLPQAKNMSVTLRGMEKGTYQIGCFPKVKEDITIEIADGTLRLNDVILLEKQALVLYIRKTESN